MDIYEIQLNMKIIIDDKILYIRGILEPYASVTYLPGAAIDNFAVRDADALIIRTRTNCNENLLKGSKVRFIATATIGFDHIDTHYCKQAGIVWSNAPGCNAASVMQWVASSLLWFKSTHGFSFTDKTLGIVGYGNVGRKVARLAEALGMNVVINDPPVARDVSPCGLISLEGLIREADIISLHVPLNLSGIDKTFHLFDHSIFDRVRKGVILLNSSRGEVVETVALKHAIRSGTILGTALDVWENEPEIDTELLSMVNIATPHIAGYAADGKANATRMAVQAVCRFFGLSENCWISPDIDYPGPQSFSVDVNETSLANALKQLIEQTYDVVADGQRLKANPLMFEQLRSDYILRRDYTAYKVTINSAQNDWKPEFKRLGFRVV